jgi:hypothetical protein
MVFGQYPVAQHSYQFCENWSLDSNVEMAPHRCMTTRGMFETESSNSLMITMKLKNNGKQ